MLTLPLDPSAQTILRQLQTRYLDISLEDLRDADRRLRGPRQILEHLAAMSVSGIDISFYAFPLVVARAGKVPYFNCPSL